MEGEELKPNAAGEAYMRLIHSEWNSGDILDQTGDLTFEKRVFQGDYVIRILNGEEVLGEKEISVSEDTLITWP